MPLKRTPLTPTSASPNTGRPPFRQWRPLMFLFVLTVCLGNYWFLSSHQHRRDMEALELEDRMVMTRTANANAKEERKPFGKNQVKKLKQLHNLLPKQAGKSSYSSLRLKYPNSMPSESASTILNYAPSRIPGYIRTETNDTLILFGHVMREFTRRICARQRAQSNVLVLSPQAPEVAHVLQHQPHNNHTSMTDAQEAALRRQFQHSVGASTLIYAHRQGHQYHGFNAYMSTHLSQWKDPPSWILLAMLDCPWNTDQVMANLYKLFQQSTVTYIVLGIGADPTHEQQVYGLEAISHLLDLQYKVQMLSLSHLPPTNALIRLLGEPNADITRQTLDPIRQALLTTAKTSGAPVHGFVFATQGLDLAIPTATAYTPTIGTTEIHYKQCPYPPETLQVQFYRPPKLHHKNSNRTLTNPQQLPKYKVLCHGQRIKLQNETKSLWISGNTMEESEAVCVRAECGGSLRAACTTRILPKQPPQEQPEQDNTKATPSSPSPPQADKPNLLLLMVDPISRARFQRSLLKTNKLIQMLNFTSFQQYTAVGNNSGPNQAALYSGKPLQSRDSIYTHHLGTEWLWETLRREGYATFKAEDGCVANSNLLPSIRPQVDHGDALLQTMCFDFQRPNCVGGTPAAKHLVEYGKQFINTYTQRHQKWAAMLHFVDGHEDTQMLEGTIDDPLWKFLFQFYHARKCDGDAPNNSNNCWSVFDNTMVVLLSDHGLHYGSYLLSPKGLKERSQPMLHLHLPKKLTTKNAKIEAALQVNRDLYTTPFDVYKTILEVMAPGAAAKRTNAPGSSLLRPLPNERTNCATTEGIPSFVCDILKEDPSQQFALLPGPPSIMSFYSDIPAANRVTRPICDAKPNNATIFTNASSSCLCATSRRKWFECTEHPWTRPNGNTLGETFSMVDCADSDTRSFEIQVQRDPRIVQRTKVATAKVSEPATTKPNILFIEVDSVSTAYADRHMPRTRELLKSLRLEKNGTDPSAFRCRGDYNLCSVDFDRASVVGPSSIPNQVAVFGACIVTVGPENCEQLETDAKDRTICSNATSPVFGMELIGRHRASYTFCPIDEAKRSPWIFDIAKKAGYVTMFSEEFCYEGSIYVPQGNIFPLDVDVEPGKFFCQTARLRTKREPELLTDGKPAWMFAYHSSPGEPNCVHKDGGYDAALVPLDHVETMWDSYQDIPKLAYVNAIAAHMYADFRFMAEKAETYDSILSSFLKRMMARSDATNTIIVVRSDHGLQCGPVTPDYSIQVEALRPWTEIVVPKTLPGLSLQKLFHNQRSLVTGFDFYKTLTASIVGKDLTIMPHPPSWTRHLWQDLVPSTRTCEEAKASNDYCLFEGQRTFTSPNVRSCNLVEADQRLVCPLLADEFEESMSKSVGHSMYTTNNIRPKICPRNDTSFNPAISPSLLRVWERLDEAAKQRPPPPPDSQSKPPTLRQTAFLTAIVSDLSNAIRKAENRSLNVCQTGFDQGHSAAMFLEASPNVRLKIFGKLNHTFQTPLLHTLQSVNGNAKRIKHNKCDSCLAMLEFEKKNGMECDFLHGLSPTSNGYDDTIIDMVKKAPCGVILTSVATKTLRDPKVYFGLNNQWAKLREQECIENIHCYSDSVDSTQKFCMAVKTGSCFGNDVQCTSKIAEVTRRIVLSQICPAHELRVPAPIRQL